MTALRLISGVAIDPLICYHPLMKPRRTFSRNSSNRQPVRPLLRRAVDRPRSALNVAVASLMWPGSKPTTEPPFAVWQNDLGLGELVQAFTSDGRYHPFIRKTFAALNTNPDVIRWRQAVLKDFLGNPGLIESVQRLLPRLAELRITYSGLVQRRSILLETAERLTELDTYLSVVQELQAALQVASIESEALRTLREELTRLIHNQSFQTLQEELPHLREPLQNLASLTIGINLDLQLRPAAAILLSINDQKFGEPASLLDRLLGFRSDANEETGIAQLHAVPDDPERRPLSPLFQDMEKLLTQVAQPIVRALTRYVHISSGPLGALEQELAFYVVAIGLMRRLQERGITLCQPEVAPIEERITQIDGLVNINLAASRKVPQSPIPSDANFDATGQIAILTGPNSGGKTTYLQAVGLAQVLFQAGLFIPAQEARISPVDAILTHFPALETRQQGRLAEEAIRLREIFQRATAHSLVLLNESLASTSLGEALFLAQDILSGLRAVGVRAIYATHLVELAARIPEIEASVPGTSDVFSLVAGVALNEEAQPVPTFKVERGAPLGRSFAQVIARRHGISLEQILAARRDQKS